METLRDLRSKTDDALEDFVKAHLLLTFKLKEIKKLRKKLDRYVKKYNTMLCQSSNLLVAQNATMQSMLEKIEDYSSELDYQKEESDRLEEKCETMGSELCATRKNERDFLSTLL